MTAATTAAGGHLAALHNITATLVEQQGGVVPYNLGVQTIFIPYLSGSSFLPLNAAASGSAYTVLAPFPGGNGTDDATVIFQAQMLIGGVVAAVDNATLVIARPDALTAAASLIQDAASITDPAAAIAATANIATLMASTVNATLKASLGAAAITMLSDSITNFDTQTTSQQAAIFDMCTSAVTSQTSTEDKASIEAQTLSLMVIALASTNFDPANGQSALTALATITTSSASAAAIVNLASKIANDASLVIGTTRVLSANGVNISAVRELASDIAGLLTSSGAGNSLTFPSNFVLDGVDSTDTISISSTASSVNPFSGADPEGAVVTYEITVNGVKRNISSLAVALIIQLANTNANSRCFYWDTTLLAWSTSGVTSSVVNGEVQCATTHLTAFGTFAGSSASAVAVGLPLLIAVLSIAIQTMI